MNLKPIFKFRNGPLMIVCICKVVSDRTIRQAVHDGARSVEAVTLATRAGSCCGSCRPQIAEMVQAIAAEGCTAPCSDCPRAKIEVASPAYLDPVGEAA
jgi:bacterioferritin-associated ferredoxin